MEHYPAVALLGPRQVGKSTLAHHIAKSRSAIYLDLESPEDLLKLNDTIHFLTKHNDKLVIIDEVQHAPDLFMSLRVLIDRYRQAGRRGENFLILGSASMDLLKQSSETLAGRICYLQMTGFNILEVIFNNNADNRETMQKLWLRGGFPESYLAANDHLSMLWLENLIRTYLERDIPQMGFKIPAIRLRRLWTMLAHLQGEFINSAKLATNLEVNNKTITHYLNIFTDLLLIRRLEPWSINVKKRIVKSPRFYIRDSGILHRLLGINDQDQLLANPILGKSWEGFVMENILSVLPAGIDAYFYRTAAGAEIDLLLMIASNEIWAIEIKYGVTFKIKPGFHNACDDIKATKKFVVYGGTDEFSFPHDITVISLEKMILRVKKLFGGP